MKLFLILCCMPLLFCMCNKNDTEPVVPPAARPFNLAAISVEGKTVANNSTTTVAGSKPAVELRFSAPVLRSSTAAITWKGTNGTAVPFTINYGAGDSIITLVPDAALASFITYNVAVTNGLQSAEKISLSSAAALTLRTTLDNTDKFSRISTDSLLTLVQKQSFKYFWDFAHPVSGLSRERNTSGDIVTSGGSGMGLMAAVVGIDRGFISKAEGLAHAQKVVTFLTNNADKFHGAFPHWLNGITGKTVPFSAKDNGADLVETSLLMQGLLAVRQYFNGINAAETNLRNGINTLWQCVEWAWFTKGGENKLYWHWSPEFGWDINLPIAGWNEALVTYVLAASSPSSTISKAVYDEGWARSGAMRNGAAYYGYTLPLGPAQGGPMFLSHYSFLGIKPFGLKDAYADYEQQVKAHTSINQAYCAANPKGFAGYSDSCWGLTASDDGKAGYLAHEPANDNGTISPTAAIASMPYAPEQSIKALEFFYYKLGDKLWGEYGFKDAFNLGDGWFADSYLAIGQGPIVIMIENYRSSLLWNLLMSAPEVRSGLTKLGFQY